MVLYFDKLIGQEAIVSHLTELVERDKLPHSLLFYGEAGLGKLELAIGLASLLVGRQVFSPDRGQTYLESVKLVRQENRESAKKIESEGLPLYRDGGDVYWLRPMKTSLSVSQWYELLQEHLTVASEGVRVVIVEDFQTANSIMANAMLKTIEEPPRGVFFIILTNQISKVLPTILSRCMAVAFRPVGDEVIRSALEAEGLVHLDQALAAGHGNPALVRTLASQGRMAMLDLALKVLVTLGQDRRAYALVALYTESLTKEQVCELLQWLQVLARDMMALRYGAPRELLQCPDYRQDLVKLLPQWTSARLECLIHETIQAQGALRLNVKTSLVVSGLTLGLLQALKEARC